MLFFLRKTHKIVFVRPGSSSLGASETHIINYTQFFCYSGQSSKESRIQRLQSDSLYYVVLCNVFKFPLWSPDFTFHKTIVVIFSKRVDRQETHPK